MLLPFTLLLLAAADRPVDPTFLHRSVEAVPARPNGSGCSYKPLFGDGDSERSIVRGVARFGVLIVAPGGRCTSANYPNEEQAYVVSEGSGALDYGGQKTPIKKHDFMYLAAGVARSLTNSGSAPVTVYVMGFKVPPAPSPSAPKLQIANYDDIQKQTVGGHPDSVVYQLMMGDTTSTRDRIAAGRVLTSLYIMEFKPGGTNTPHHHDDAEEIYVLLDGAGDMVAGEGRYPAKPGDAYFFRLNATVGFYNGPGVSHILAVRSFYPRR